MSTLDMPQPSMAPNLGLTRPWRLALASLVLLIGILGTWASLSTINGAVVASGQATIQGKPKLIQSLDGGVVAEILVRDGDIVQEGDVLMRLDPTLLEVNLEIARSQLAAALAMRARLIAEQTGSNTPVFEDADPRFGQIDMALHERGQTAIFAARAAVLKGRRAQLEEAVLQFAHQSEGVRGQIAALNDQVALLEHDLANMRSLIDKDLARQSQLSQLQRDKSQLMGQLASLKAELARLTSAPRDARLETLQAENSYMEGVVTELRDVTSRIEELKLQIVTHHAALSRIDITAPTAGVVHEMQVTTQGGVVPSGGTIASIVPLAKDMDFELRVDPRSIDEVHPGQEASLMVASFDAMTTPRLSARVASISPDVIEDPRTGQAFYRVALQVPPAELAKLGDVILMSGMPVEAYLETGHRSVLSYLLYPVTSHLRRALRE